MVTRGCVLAVKYDGYGECTDTYFTWLRWMYGCVFQPSSVFNQWMGVSALEHYGCSGCVFQPSSITAVADVCFSHRALRLKRMCVSAIENYGCSGCVF